MLDGVKYKQYNRATGLWEVKYKTVTIEKDGMPTLRVEKSASKKKSIRMKNQSKKSKKLKGAVKPKRGRPRKNGGE